MKRHVGCDEAPIKDPMAPRRGQRKICAWRSFEGFALVSNWILGWSHHRSQTSSESSIGCPRFRWQQMLRRPTRDE